MIVFLLIKNFSDIFTISPKRNMREMGIKQKDDSRVVVASTDCDGGVEFMGGFCHLSQYRGLLLAVGSPWLQHFNLSFNLFLLFGH